jgi:hypothetical protein
LGFIFGNVTGNVIVNLTSNPTNVNTDICRPVGNPLHTSRALIEKYKKIEEMYKRMKIGSLSYEYISK